MYCFYLINNKTNEETMVFGYSWENAVKRSGKNFTDWTCIGRDYLD